MAKHKNHLLFNLRDLVYKQWYIIQHDYCIVIMSIDIKGRYHLLKMHVHYKTESIISYDL